MTPTKDGAYLLPTVFMAWVSLVQPQPVSTCVGGAYHSGERARVTCFFNGEMNTGTNEGVSIVLRDFYSPRTSPGKEVLKCSFAGDTVSVCETEDNFSFLSFHKNNLTMEIPQVSAEFQGSYECGVIPSGGQTSQTDTHSCFLIVDGVHTSCSMPDMKCVSRCSAAYVNLVLLLILLVSGILLFLFVNQRQRWFTLPFSQFIMRARRGDAEQGSPEEQQSMNPEMTLEQTAAPPNNEASPVPPSVPSTPNRSRDQQQAVHVVGTPNRASGERNQTLANTTDRNDAGNCNVL